MTHLDCDLIKNVHVVFNQAQLSSNLSKSLKCCKHFCFGNLGQIGKYSLKICYWSKVNASDRKLEIRLCMHVSI